MTEVKKEKTKFKTLLIKIFANKFVKNKWVRVIFIIIAVLCGLLGVVKKYFNVNIPTDNPVEELIEDIIETQIGREIDLTPDSPEIKKIATDHTH